MSRREDDLNRTRAHLSALSKTLPKLIARVRELDEQTGSPSTAALPHAERTAERLSGFAAYLEQFGQEGDPAPGPIALRTLLDEVLALTRGEIEMRGRILTKYRAAPMVVASTRVLGQVFISLLVNAAQALPEGAPASHRVEVALDTSAAGRARVVISDTGVGIAPIELPHIFDALYSSKRGAGLGIGLAIVREVIEGLGGSVVVHSEVGRGTQFTIELPAAVVTS